MLSHWAANGLSPLMSGKRHLKNMPREKKQPYPCLHPSRFVMVINKAEKGELQVSVGIRLESK